MNIIDRRKLFRPLRVVFVIDGCLFWKTKFTDERIVTNKMFLEFQKRNI